MAGRSPAARGSPPVVEQLLARERCVVVLMNAAVGEVGAEGSVGVAAAELVERVAFPRVALALIVGEGHRGKPVGEAGERATGVDLRKLAGVAHEHDLRSGVLSMVEDALQLAGSDHGSFIDHEH
jgi:hypothetical protein